MRLTRVSEPHRRTMMSSAHACLAVRANDWMSEATLIIRIVAKTNKNAAAKGAAAVPAKPQDEAARAYWARVRLLNEELDRLGVDAAERTSSVLNKASFLAVSAGVLVAAATSQVWRAAPLFGVASLALACVALACAAVSLRPAKRMAVQAQRLVDRHMDCDHTAIYVEAELVHDKATVLTAREGDLAARARWVWGGFMALASSALALSIVFSIEVLGG